MDLTRKIMNALVDILKIACRLTQKNLIKEISIGIVFSWLLNFEELTS